MAATAANSAATVLALVRFHSTLGRSQRNGCCTIFRLMAAADCSVCITMMRLLWTQLNDGLSCTQLSGIPEPRTWTLGICDQWSRHWKSHRSRASFNGLNVPSCYRYMIAHGHWLCTWRHHTVIVSNCFIQTCHSVFMYSTSWVVPSIRDAIFLVKNNDLIWIRQLGLQVIYHAMIYNCALTDCDTGWRYQLGQQVEFVVILLLLKCLCWWWQWPQ